jgi:hypothetical protein
MILLILSSLGHLPKTRLKGGGISYLKEWKGPLKINYQHWLKMQIIVLMMQGIGKMTIFFAK